MLESADAGDEKAITAMGLLKTMETILAVMEERPEVHQALEPVILQVRLSLHLAHLPGEIYRNIYRCLFYQLF